MKIKRPLAAVSGTLVLVVGAASFALLGAGGAATAAGTPSRAHGLELTIAGTPAIDRMPSVVSTDGTLVSKELVDADTLNPLLSGGIVQVSAQNGAASANVTGLGVGNGLLSQLPAELTEPLEQGCTQLVDALGPLTEPVGQGLSQLLSTVQGALDQIADSTAGSPVNLSLLGALDVTKLTALQLDRLCTVLGGTGPLVELPTVTATCTGNTGKVAVVDNTGSALGLPLSIPVNEPNAKVEIPGLLTLTANRQTTNADGTFTVDALHLNLLGQIQLTVASATCGVVTRDVAPAPGGSDAPSPTPVKTNAPVTG